MSDTLTVADEVVRWFEAGDETILSVITRPTVAPRGVGVIFLNGGHGGSSSGKNRIYTRMAADLADRGFHSIRLEWHGIGDSTGAVDEYIMDEPFLDECFAAAQMLRDEGVERIAIYGECFGARTAVVAAERLPDLAAMYLVTLVLRDGAVSDQNPQRMVDTLPTKEYVKRIGKLRHIGDAKRRKLYVKVIRSKARQIMRGARYRREGTKLAPWVSRQVVDGLEGLGARGVPVRLVYGTSYWDPHKFDFEEVADELRPMRYPCIDSEIVDEMIAGYRTLPIQDRLVPMVGAWFDETLPGAASGSDAA
jgi:pimeloyl-ACP methyl ester carboxylesterase